MMIQILKMSLVFNKECILYCFDCMVRTGPVTVATLEHTRWAIFWPLRRLARSLKNVMSPLIRSGLSRMFILVAVASSGGHAMAGPLDPSAFALLGTASLARTLRDQHAGGRRPDHPRQRRSALHRRHLQRRGDLRLQLALRRPGCHRFRHPRVGYTAGGPAVPDDRGHRRESRRLRVGSPDGIGCRALI
jgi:hypothetical protein